MDTIQLTVVLIALLGTPCTPAVDTVWMNKVLTDHFSKTRHHVTNPDYKNATMRFIIDQFREMGLDTHVHVFPTETPEVMGVNVIGVIKGRYFNTADDNIVGIAAHYDTMRHTPGVNDNGAAMVTLLQTAREVAGQLQRNHTVVFLAFDFEEWENPGSASQVACTSICCGSRKLLDQWVPNFWTTQSRWQGVYVMDTILNFNGSIQSQSFPQGIEQIFPGPAQSISSDGGRGDFLMVAGREVETDLVNAFSNAWKSQGDVKFEVESFIVPQLPNPLPQQMTESNELVGQILRSDHGPFWIRGLKAVFITDTADFRGYMHTCYHDMCDELTKVSSDMLKFIAKTSSTLISLVNSMSPVVQGNTSAASQNQASAFLLVVLVIKLCAVRG